MRKWIGSLLIFVMTIVLTINVVRCFFYEDHVASVDTFTVLEAFSEIDIDPSPLYNDVVAGSSMMASFGANFYDAFSYHTYQDSKSVLTSITRFFKCIVGSFQDLWYFAANFIFLIKDVSVFMYQFFTTIFKFLNKVLGTLFNTYGSKYVPKGYSGGGFGARR